LSGQRVGYARVSTLDQNTARQLGGVPVDRTFTDHVSGKDLDRPELDAMLGFVRDGDTVIVHSMDRLARNLDDLRATVRRLTGKGVKVQFVKEQLTFTGDDTAMATLLLSVMGAFAEFERSLIRERQREGIALAKQRGAYRGRRKALTPDDVDRLRDQPRNRLPIFTFGGPGTRCCCAPAGAECDLSVSARPIESSDRAR
jgi:DNA invertase Pin-like site-specific DNA recombinase